MFCPAAPTMNVSQSSAGHAAPGAIATPSWDALTEKCWLTRAACGALGARRASLYERPVNLDSAKAAHADFRRVMREHGVKVLSFPPFCTKKQLCQSVSCAILSWHLAKQAEVVWEQPCSGVG